MNKSYSAKAERASVAILDIIGNKTPSLRMGDKATEIDVLMSRIDFFSYFRLSLLKTAIYVSVHPIG